MSERELLAAADFACQREVGPVHQHQRTHQDRDRREPALPHAVSRQYGGRARPGHWPGPGVCLWPDPAGKPLHHGCTLACRRLWPDAGDARHRALDGQEDWPDRLHARPDLDRDTNITIGTAYLKLALDDFAGSMPLAAAACNANPGRPRNWRNGPVLDAAIWAENVPFAETRDYVKKVLANTTNYAALLTGQPQSLRSRLAPWGHAMQRRR